MQLLPVKKGMSLPHIEAQRIWIKSRSPLLELRCGTGNCTVSNERGRTTWSAFINMAAYPE
jgi:hypothetical protein